MGRKSDSRRRAAGVKALAALLVLSFTFSASCAFLPGYTSSADIAAENLAIAEGYAGLSKHDKAELYYKKASRVREFRNAGNWGLARTYALTGNWKEAIPLLEGLYAQDNSNVLIKKAYAYALVAGGASDKGLELYASLKEKSPDDPQSAVNYVEALTLAGKWQEALDASSAIRDKFPEAGETSRLDTLEEKCKAALNPAAADGAGTVEPAAGDQKSAPESAPTANP